MKIRVLITALLLVCSINLINAHNEGEALIPTRGKIYHPGNAEHFQNALKAFDLVIVDFYADWCGPCRSMHKVIEDLASDRDCEDILFIKVNTDSERHLSNHYNITSLPTLIFFVDGQPIRIIYGYHSKRDMKQLIAQTFRVPKA